MKKELALLLAAAVCVVLADRPPCSLNGDLVDGVCHCDAAWVGEECERLNLLPGAPDAGLQTHGELGISSSWGGSVLRDAKEGGYHMFAAVIEHGCGLNAWRPNSAIGHATSSQPAGPYKLKRIIKPHFAHSPEVVRGSDGAWLVYHVGAGRNNTAHCPDPSAQTCQYTTNCSAGCTGPQHPWLSGIGFHGPAAVLRAASPEGPWASTDIGECAQVPGCEPDPSKKFPGNGNDMNPAPFMLPDGAVKMLWRSINNTAGSGQSYYAMASAPAWNGPFKWSTANIFADFSWCHIEDGFLYNNSRGWHAIFHSDCEKTSHGAAGGHGYSADGTTWHFHPKNAYNNTVQLADGTHWVLNRRERPKLILDARGQITHLINGVSLPGKANDCAHPDHPLRAGGITPSRLFSPLRLRASAAR